MANNGHFKGNHHLKPFDESIKDRLWLNSKVKSALELDALTSLAVVSDTKTGIDQVPEIVYDVRDMLLESMGQRG